LQHLYSEQSSQLLVKRKERLESEEGTVGEGRRNGWRVKKERLEERRRNGWRSEEGTVGRVKKERFFGLIIPVTIHNKTLR
jgi:hypothetical protein